MWRWLGCCGERTESDRMKDDHIYALRLKKEQIERLDWLKERFDNGCSRISWASIINYAIEELYARECEKALRE